MDMSFLDSANALAHGELSGEENGAGVLETAYLILKDCRKGKAETISTSRTKSILSGLSSERMNAMKSTPKSPLSGTKTIKVQFNPASLNFQSGMESAKREKAGIDKKENGDEEVADGEKREKRLSVSMKLIFDRTIYIDSSVQPEVESFLGMIKNPYIRQVTFCWGKLYYAGVVKRVSTEYNMFNALGIPMRATVDLTIEIM